MPLPRPLLQSTVLVVEDDEVLRMCAAQVVADAGFTPVEAANADEAFAILENRSDIALLFTDIQMPGSMNGLDLARTVHDLYFDLSTRSSSRGPSGVSRMHSLWRSRNWIPSRSLSRRPYWVNS